MIDLGFFGEWPSIWAMLANIFFLLFFMASHEFGHYWVAKRQGVFKEFGLWIGNPCVRMTKPLERKIDYMAGFIFSYFALPVLYIIVHLGWMQSEMKLGVFWSFTIIALGFSVGDIIIMFIAGKRFNVPDWLGNILIKLKIGEKTEKK